MSSFDHFLPGGLVLRFIFLRYNMRSFQRLMFPRKRRFRDTDVSESSGNVSFSETSPLGNVVFSETSPTQNIVFSGLKMSFMAINKIFELKKSDYLQKIDKIGDFRRKLKIFDASQIGVTKNHNSDFSNDWVLITHVCPKRSITAPAGLTS